MTMIDFNHFKEVEIKIGTIISAKIMSNTDKLIKLSVELGEDKPRQIIAGLAKHISNPEDIIGKQIPVVTNLEPRIICGEESQGMVLVVKDKDELVMVHPEKEVLPGSNIQ